MQELSLCSLYAVLICILLSKNGLIAFLSIENSKESKSRRGAQVVLTNKKQRLCSSKLLSLQTIRQITNHYQCTLVFSFESSASYHKERKQEVQTCWNWQTLTVCCSWFLHVKSTHKNKFVYIFLMHSIQFISK